jgi:hypothetical protein
LRAIITNSISFGPERWAGRANVSTAPELRITSGQFGRDDAWRGHGTDALLAHYFKTDDLASVDDVSLVLGCEQLALDFGVEQEGGRKFALWWCWTRWVWRPPAEAFKDHPELVEPAYDWQRTADRATRDQS